MQLLSPVLHARGALIYDFRRKRDANLLFPSLYRVYLILEKCRLYKLASKRNILLGQVNEDLCSDNEIVRRGYLEGHFCPFC
jgi:hypothetical protein